MKATPCTVEECNKFVIAKGLCTTHYARLRKTGSTTTTRVLRTRREDQAACSIDGCDKAVNGRGWCVTHYQRWRKTGTTDAPQYSGACSVDGCAAPSVAARGMCTLHYKRWRKAQQGPYSKYDSGAIPQLDLPPSLASEEWRPVVGWEGFYDVSNLGRVRGVQRLITQADGRKRLFRPAIINGIPRKADGYLQISLSANNKPQNVLIHSLVAAAFIGPRPEGFEVAHWDGNPGNNHLSNLRYATPQENTDDKARHARERGVA